MLILSPRYTSPTTSSNILYTYPELTEIAVYCLEQPEKQEFMYTHERLKGEK